MTIAPDTLPGDFFDAPQNHAASTAPDTLPGDFFDEKQAPDTLPGDFFDPPATQQPTTQPPANRLNRVIKDGRRAWQAFADAEVKKSPFLSDEDKRAIYGKWQAQAGQTLPTPEQVTPPSTNPVIAASKAAVSGFAKAGAGLVDIGQKITPYAPQYVKDATGNFVQGTYQRANQFEQQVPTADTIPNKIGGFVGGAVPVTTAVATGNLSAIIASGASQSAGSTGSEIQRLRDEGAQISPTAESVATLGSGAIGGVSGALPFSVGKTIADKVGGPLAQRVAAGMVGTTVEQAVVNPATTIAENALAQQTFDPNRPLTQGALESAAMAPVGGIMFGGVAGSHSRAEANRTNNRILAMEQLRQQNPTVHVQPNEDFPAPVARAQEIPHQPVPQVEPQRPAPESQPVAQPTPTLKIDDSRPVVAPPVDQGVRPRSTPVEGPLPRSEAPAPTVRPPEGFTLDQPKEPPNAPAVQPEQPAVRGDGGEPAIRDMASQPEGRVEPAAPPVRGVRDGSVGEAGTEPANRDTAVQDQATAGGRPVDQPAVKQDAQVTQPKQKTQRQTEVEAEIAHVRKEFPGANIEVVDSPADLPADVVADVGADRAGRARALYVRKDGRMFVVAGNLKKGRAARSLRHEIVGHLGSDEAFTDGERAGLVKFAEDNAPDVVKSVRETYAPELQNMEIIARLGEKFGKSRPAWYVEMLDTIRMAWKRVTGRDFSHADVENLYRRASKAAKKKLATAPVETTPAVKQPWEMTREEYIDWHLGESRKLETLRTSKENLHRNFKDGGQYQIALAKKNEEIRLAEANYRAAGFGKSPDYVHRNAVTQALKEGKPVPPEVLADYPELKATPPVSEPAARGEKVVYRAVRDPKSPKNRPTYYVQTDDGKNIIGNGLSFKAAQALATKRNRESGATQERKPPAEDSFAKRRVEAEMQLRAEVFKHFGTRDTSESVARAVERGEMPLGHNVSLERAIDEAENAPQGHPVKMALHNLREIQKNSNRTKIQAVNTNDVPDGTRVQFNDQETVTIDKEEMMLKDGIRTELPEDGMTLYGKKVLPPEEGEKDVGEFAPPKEENPYADVSDEALLGQQDYYNRRTTELRDFEKQRKADVDKEIARRGLKPAFYEPTVSQSDKGIFGQDVTKSAGIGEQQGMFHEPVDVPLPKKKEFAQFEDEATPGMFEKKSPPPPSEGKKPSGSSSTADVAADVPPKTGKLDALDAWAKKKLDELGGTGLRGGIPIDPIKDPIRLALYAVRGAAKIGKGAQRFTTWSRAMAQEFTELTKAQLAHVWRVARRLHKLPEEDRVEWMNDQFTTKGETAPMPLIRQNTGLADKSKFVREMAALRASMRKAQEASRAGYKAGAEVTRDAERARAAKREDQIERTALKQSLSRQATAAAEGYQTGVDTVQGIKKELVRIINDTLPREIQQPMLRDVAKVRSLAGLRAATAKASRLLADHDVKQALRRVEKLTGKLVLEVPERESRMAEGTEAQQAEDAGKKAVRRLERMAMKEVDLNRIDPAYRDRFKPLIEEAKVVKSSLAGAKTVDEKYAAVHAFNRVFGKLYELNMMHAAERLHKVGSDKVAVADKRQQIIKQIQDRKQLSQPDARQGEKPRDVGVLHRWIGRRAATPETAILDIDQRFDDGGNAGEVILRDIRRAENAKAGEVGKFEDGRNQALERAGYKVGTRKYSNFLTEKEQVKLPDAGDVGLTRSEQVGLYAMWRDPETRELIEKHGRAKFNHARDMNAPEFTLTPRDFEQIAQRLTSDERAMKDVWFDDYNKKTLRERTMAAKFDLSGFAPEPHDGYFPRRVNFEKSDTAGEPLSMRQAKRALENVSQTEERAQHDQVFLIPDFIRDSDRFIKDSSTLIHLAKPVRTVRMLLEHPDTKTAIRSRYGESMNRELDKFLLNLTESPDPPSADRGIMNAVHKGFYRANLALNPRTFANNVLGGTEMLFPMFDAQDFGPAIKDAFSGKIHQEVIDASHIAAQRWASPLHESYGAFAHTGEQRGRLSIGEALKSVGDAVATADVSRIFSDLGRTADAITLMNVADAAPFHVAWSAAKREVARLHPEFNPEQAKQAVLDKFHDVVMRTQNGMTPTETSGLWYDARSSLVLKGLTLLRSDANKKLNLIMQARHADTKTRAKLLGAIAANVATGAATRTLFTGTAAGILARVLMGGDVQDEEKEKIARGAASKAFDDLAGIVPGGDWLTTAVKTAATGGDYTLQPIPAAQPISDTVEGSSRMVKGQYARGAYRILNALRTLAGDPTLPITRDIVNAVTSFNVEEKTPEQKKQDEIIRKKNQDERTRGDYIPSVAKEKAKERSRLNSVGNANLSSADRSRRDKLNAWYNNQYSMALKAMRNRQEDFDKGKIDQATLRKELERISDQLAASSR